MNAKQWCEDHEGERLADHPEPKGADGKAIDWLDYYPVVDEGGCLTGEAVYLPDQDDGFVMVNLNADGVPYLHDSQIGPDPVAMMAR